MEKLLMSFIRSLQTTSAQFLTLSSLRLSVTPLSSTAGYHRSYEEVPHCLPIYVAADELRDTQRVLTSDLPNQPAARAGRDLQPAR